MISPAFAKTIFPTYDWRIDRPPTYCMIRPLPEVAPEHMTIGYLNRFTEAVGDWSQKLIAEDLGNRNNWVMKTKVLSEISVAKDGGCDIPVRIEIQDIEAVGRYCSVYYSYNPDAVCHNPPKYGNPWIQMFVKSWGNFRTDEAFFSTAKHEIGHSFGLGHFSSDDNELNSKWVTTAPSPSVMIIPGHKIPELRTVTQLDIDMVRSLYGDNGFFTFVPTPAPTPSPTPKPIPIPPTPIPTPKPIPKAFNLFEYITINGEEQIVRPNRSYETILLKISGQISETEFLRGLPVYLLVIKPTQLETLKLTPTSKGYFETTIIIDKNSPFGEYRIQGIYQEKQQYNKDVFFKVVSTHTTITAREILKGPFTPKTPSISSSSNEGVGIWKFSTSHLRVLDKYGKTIHDLFPEQPLQVKTDFRNLQDRTQYFTYLVQIHDEKGDSIFLKSINGRLSPKESTSHYLTWIPESRGEYTITVNVWESQDNPTSLSPPLKSIVNVEGISLHEVTTKREELIKIIRGLEYGSTISQQSLEKLNFKQEDAVNKINLAWDNLKDTKKRINVLNSNYLADMDSAIENNQLELADSQFNRAKSSATKAGDNLMQISKLIDEAKKLEEFRKQEKTCFLFWCW